MAATAAAAVRLPLPPASPPPTPVRMFFIPIPLPPRPTLRGRSVMRARCELFRARCDSGMRDADSALCLVPDHFSREAVEALLHYAYHDELPQGLDPQVCVGVFVCGGWGGGVLNSVDTWGFDGWACRWGWRACGGLGLGVMGGMLCCVMFGWGLGI